MSTSLTLRNGEMPYLIQKGMEYQDLRYKHESRSTH